MAPAGFKSVEIAQQNGSWNLLDEVEALVIPDDLTQAFSRHEGSMEYFSGLSKSIKKIVVAIAIVAIYSILLIFSILFDQFTSYFQCVLIT